MNKLVMFLGIICFSYGTLVAQSIPTDINNTNDKGHAWEVGVHAGHLFSTGNVDFTPGFGAGIHLRKALDYVFSLRGTLMYGNLAGEDEGNVRSFETTYLSGSLQALVTLNNLKWTLGERKMNLYLLAGFGFNTFEAELTQNDLLSKVDSDIASQLEFGGGISFRINDKLNVAIEHQVASVLGSRSDLVDGVATLTAVKDARSTFHDMLQYTQVKLNFNLRGKNTKTEPLYWLNPMEAVVNDVQLLKDTRVTLTDDDDDGIIDLLDEQEGTPSGAPVNAKGIAVDSDNDGLADYEDKEPFSPAGYEINNEGVAQVPDIMEEVNKLVEAKLKDFSPITPASQPTNSLNNWYLPSIYFAPNASVVEDSSYGTLYNIAKVLKANPDTKILVVGHADNAGAVEYNNKLSYARANSVIQYLVNEMGVSRSSLVLQYKGEAENIIDKIHEVNRRVDFNVAKGEAEMTAPTN